MQRYDSLRLSRRQLTELQWLCHDRLFVMSKAAAETNRRREDDRASYKDTHGKSPIPFIAAFPATTYTGLPPENCDT